MVRNKIKIWAFLKVALIVMSLSSLLIMSSPVSASALSLSNNTVATSAAPGINCSVDFNPTTWLICPLISGMSAVVEGFDSYITSALTIDPCVYFNASTAPDPSCSKQSSNTPASSQSNITSTGFYTAWSSFRDIALGLMVIGALIMVISQIVGFELLDAYTIRKVLPRIIIAAIGISLSWQLMQFLIQFSNDLGNGISYLIYHPFTTGANSISNKGVVITNGVSSAGAILSFAAITTLGIMATLSFVLVALVAAFLGFAVVVLRQILIIFLALLSPIAIAMFILPGTSKVWKLWWNTFFKALLMFPLIIGMIAIGRVFAAISSQNGGSIGQFIAFIAYFGPYFIIPQTFKFAGGILSAAGGAASRTNKAFGKAAGEYRGRERKRLAELGARGERFRHGKQTGFSGFLNRRTIGISSGVGGRFGIGERGASKIEQIQKDRDVANLSENKSLMNLAQTSSEGIAILAASGGTVQGARQARNRLKSLMVENDVADKIAKKPGATSDDIAVFRTNAEASAEAATQSGFLQAQAVGFTTSNSRGAFNAAAANKWRALGPIGANDFIDEGLSRAYSNSDTLKAEAAQTQAYNARKSGRTDIGGVDKTTGKTSASDGFAKAGAHAVARDYGDSLKSQVNRLLRDLGGSNAKDSIDAAAQLAALRGAMGPDLPLSNQIIINDALEKAGVNLGSDEDVATQLGALVASKSPTPTTSKEMANIIRHRIGAYVGPPMGGMGGQPPIAPEE